MEQTTLNAPAAPVAEVPAKPKKKRSRKKKIFLGIVLLLVAAFVVNTVVSAVRGPAPTQVSTETVGKGEIAQTLSTSGTLISGNQVTVYSPVSAPVAEVNARLGGMVSAEELLVTYDTADLSRSYRTASAAAASGSLQKQDTLANSEKSQANFNNAAATLDNAAVQKDNATATLASLTAQYEALADKTTAEAQSLKAAVDAAAADLAAMQSALQGAKAAYDAAAGGVLSENGKKQLDYGQVAASVSLEKANEDLKEGKAGVKAPIRGVVSSLTATPGAMVSEYSPLCVIESLDDVRVQIALSRYDLEKVAVGQEATVTSLGKSYTGKVTTVDSVATTSAVTNGATTAYVRAEITLDAPDDAIRLGLEANVLLHTGSASDVLTIPLSAVNTDVNGQFCYVIENGVAVRRVVKTGLSSDTRIEVLTGLSAGDVLITDPQNVLAEGSKVASTALPEAGTGENADAAGLSMTVTK